MYETERKNEFLLSCFKKKMESKTKGISFLILKLKQFKGYKSLKEMGLGTVYKRAKMSID